MIKPEKDCHLVSELKKKTEKFFYVLKIYFIAVIFLNPTKLNYSCRLIKMKGSKITFCMNHNFHVYLIVKYNGYVFKVHVPI